MSKKYWLQTQAPAGNWSDLLGVDTLEQAALRGRWLAENHGDNWRVVIRTDKVVAVGTTNKRKSNPRPRIGAAKPQRVSSATGKRPTKRLVSRRKANTRKGYFPNPRRRALKWNEFGSSFGKKHSFSVHLPEANGRAMFTIDPVYTQTGRFIAYELKGFAIPGEQSTGWKNYGTANRATTLQRKASEIYNRGIGALPPLHVISESPHRKNPVRRLAIRAGIRFYRKHGGKWLMFDPATYPAKTRAEAQRIANDLAQMFKTQIKVIIDK